MAYGDLYQRRKPVPPEQAAASPQPQNESMVDFYKRLGKVPIDARSGDGYTDAERQQAREIRFAIAEGRFWYPGTVLPHRLAPLVFDGAMPESFQQGRHTVDASSIAASYDTTGGGDVVARLARKVNASLSLSASLATDNPRSRRDLATDQDPHRPTMSYKLAQVMGDYEYVDEDSFDAAMKQWGVTEPRDRIALKSEALALRMMRARGTPLPTPQKSRQYHAVPGADDPKHQHAIDKKSPAATKSTAGTNTIPTMQACTSDGFACYDRTSIEL